MTEMITVEIPAPPKGWKYDGFRIPQRGERFFSHDSWMNLWNETPCRIKHFVAVPDILWAQQQTFPFLAREARRDLIVRLYFKDTQDDYWGLIDEGDRKGDCICCGPEQLEPV